LSRFNRLKDENDPFSIVSINEAGKLVAKELVVVLKENGKFELSYKKDVEAFDKIREL